MRGLLAAYAIGAKQPLVTFNILAHGTLHFEQLVIQYGQNRKCAKLCRLKGSLKWGKRTAYHNRTERQSGSACSTTPEVIAALCRTDYLLLE